MIVVDTNVVVYRLIEGPQTPLARRVRALDPDWRLPALWPHELLNVLAAYVQKGGATLLAAQRLWWQAWLTFERGTLPVDLSMVLQIAVESRVSAHDAQFIALARTFGVPCVTEDRQLLARFPRSTLSMLAFCRR